jgi:nitrate reductase beta subunit
VVAASLEKLIALRIHMRAKNLNQPPDEAILAGAGLDEDGAKRLYRLFTVGGYNERNIIPPQQREELDSHTRKGASGFGILKKTGRGKR